MSSYQNILINLFAKNNDVSFVAYLGEVHGWNLV